MYTNLINITKYVENPKERNGTISFVAPRLLSSTGGTPYYRFKGHVQDEKGKPYIVVDGKPAEGYIWINAKYVEEALKNLIGDEWKPEDLEGRTIEVDIEQLKNAINANITKVSKFPDFTLAVTWLTILV